MAREYLATRLISGDDQAPAKTSWWPRHCRLSSGYMDACLEGRRPELKTIESTAIRCAEEFETICFGKHNFVMLEHVELELNLVDAAVDGSALRVRDIGDRLVNNVSALVVEFRERFTDFPSQRYAYLLARHVVDFVATVEAKAFGNVEAGVRFAAAYHKNTIALAGFTTEWVL